MIRDKGKGTKKRRRRMCRRKRAETKEQNE